MFADSVPIGRAETAALSRMDVSPCVAVVCRGYHMVVSALASRVFKLLCWLTGLSVCIKYRDSAEDQQDKHSVSAPCVHCKQHFITNTGIRMRCNVSKHAAICSLPACVYSLQYVQHYPDRPCIYYMSIMTSLQSHNIST